MKLQPLRRHKLQQHIYSYTQFITTTKFATNLGHQRNKEAVLKSEKQQVFTLRQYETAESRQQSLMTSLVQRRQRPQKVRDGQRCLVGQQSQQPQGDVHTHLQQHLAKPCDVSVSKSSLTSFHYSLTEV